LKYNATLLFFLFFFIFSIFLFWPCVYPTSPTRGPRGGSTLARVENERRQGARRQQRRGGQRGRMLFDGWMHVPASSFMF
ncbi:hypothetical protein GGR50DRAFT_650826, partial [Xylaria sp. CBS 124048]